MLYGRILIGLFTLLFTHDLIVRENKTAALGRCFANNSSGDGLCRACGFFRVLSLRFGECAHE